MIKQRDNKVEQKNKHIEEKNDNKESSGINQNVDIDEVNQINEDKQEKEDENIECEKNLKTDIVSKQSSTKYERCIVSKCDGDIHNIKLNRLSITVIWILAITTRMYLIHEPTHIW